MADTLIDQVTIVDGTGSPPFTGQVRIRDDRIDSVRAAEDGRGANAADAETIIDGRGLALAPGFIDCHSHFDWTLPLPDHETFLYPMAEQGVTTVVTGNCGFSPAPVAASVQGLVQQYSEMLLERPFPFEWEEMGGFLDRLEAMDGLLFNHVQLVGHGTVQLSVVGNRTDQPDARALSRMVALTRTAFDQGARGLSFGLMYPPGIFSTRKNLTTMARTAAESGRLVTVHKRALSRYSGSYPVIPFFGRPHNLKALDEVLSIGLETGARLQISHFIFVGKKSWPTAARAVEMVEEAAARGLEVMWDIYPNFCGNSYLDVFLPAWFIENLAENLQRPLAVRRLKLELAAARKLLGFEMADIQIMDAGYGAGEKYNGLTLTEIAAREGIDPVDVMLNIIRASNSKALQLTYGYSGDERHEQLLASLMKSKRCLFETDTILKSRGFANPCAFGAFPRILGRFVRETGTLSLSEAVHKMTGATARWMGIAERGEIRPGFFADLVLFDPLTIADTTTRKKTDRRPAGIEKVFLNGALVVDNGAYQHNVKAGRVLR